MSSENENEPPTEQEIAWAIAIKAAAQNDPDVDDAVVTDLEFLQHAIIAKDKVEDALLQLKKLQAFKDRFGIFGDGSYEQGIRDLITYQRVNAGLLLAFGTLPDGSQIACVDGARWVVHANHESLAVYLRGSFYLLQCAHGNISAMRQGIVSLSDSAGSTIRNILQPRQVLKRNHDFVCHAYPVRIKSMIVMNVTWPMRWLFHLVKPKALVQCLLCGNAQVFLQASAIPKDVLPKQWGGSVDFDDLQVALQQRLRARYEWAATFTLPEY